MAKKEVKPFYSVHQDFIASLQAFANQANNMREFVGSLVSAGQLSDGMATMAQRQCDDFDNAANGAKAR